jgi:hypothetical protein
MVPIPAGAVPPSAAQRGQARFIDAVMRILAYESCTTLAIGADFAGAIGAKVDALLTSVWGLASRA